MEKIKVLLVEDDEEDYLITRRRLAEIGSENYELTWARDYDAALEMMARQRFDVCLLDYRLGERTGLEFLREAREAGHDAPMILLTGLGDPEIDLQAMRAGAADYLVKADLSADLLERSIRYAIAQWRNEQLVKERAQAEAAIIAKDEFVALVSHELRNPLSSILGWARVLAKGQADADTAAQAITTIVRSAEAQKRLIDDLLDMARVAGGKLRLEARPLDLAPVLNEALDAARFAAEAKGVELGASLDPEAGQVTGDPARLQQVVWNLLSNAVKFTPAGGRVEIELRRAGPHAQIQVRDTGRGISPDFLPHVFEQFRQADEAGGERRSGLGLGLSLVRRLVEAHGGTVEAASAGEGQGATFTVKLPVRAVRADERQPPPESAARLGGWRVLVVDDDEDARELVAISLRQYGAQVNTAASAAEALGRLGGGPLPDVIVSDLGMPEEDGFAFIRRVRALPPEQGGGIPMIALTAYAGRNDRLRALSAGFQAHVPKPVEVEELAFVIAALADH